MLNCDSNHSTVTQATSSALLLDSTLNNHLSETTPAVPHDVLHDGISQVATVPSAVGPEASSGTAPLGTTSPAVTADLMLSPSVEIGVAEVTGFAGSVAMDEPALWSGVARNLNSERLSKFRAGLFLYKLQKMYGKAGRGTFVQRAKQFAKDWDISLSTVYQRIAFYKNVQRGRAELLLVCISAEDWAKWGGFDDDEVFDLAAEQATSDAQVARMNALIAKAEQQVATAREASGDKAPVKSVKLEGLDLVQRKEISSLIAELTIAKGGSSAFAAWLFELLKHEAELATSPAASESEGDNNA